jgi:hypothetical protein
MIGNEDQDQAVLLSKTMREGFLLVHGPPGTGKSATIVRIVASHLMAAKAYRERSFSPATPVGSASRAPRGRVLVCAPTNVAVSLILSRLAGALPQSMYGRFRARARCVCVCVCVCVFNIILTCKSNLSYSPPPSQNGAGGAL